MAKTKISEYDSTAANNTDIDGINIAEGMAPSNVNNAIRELMAHLKDMNIGSTITMLNTTEEDTDGGRESTLIFKGEQSGGEISTLAEIEASHDGALDDEKGDLIFRTNDGSDGTSPTEAARIDSSQNLLVGKTSQGIANQGFEALSTGQTQITNDGGHSLVLNRLTSDGDIATFRKSGTTVGSIGTQGGDIQLGTGVVGVRFKDADNAIQPQNITTSAGRDNLTDLGTDSARFKDLYLGGGAYIGGTVAANKLDEYEEGTWNPTVNVGSESSFRATYVKVGDFVWVSANLGDITETSSTSDVQIGGLPYTSHADNQSTGSVMFRYLNAPTNYIQLTPLVNPSSTSIIFYWSSGAGATWDGLRFADVQGSSPWDMIIGIGYRATG